MGISNYKWPNDNPNLGFVRKLSWYYRILSVNMCDLTKNGPQMTFWVNFSFRLIKLSSLYRYLLGTKVISHNSRAHQQRPSGEITHIKDIRVELGWGESKEY